MGSIQNPKANILLIGSGGVGTLSAYNLEIGGLATVTAVLRSNYDVVTSKGFTIDSIDHGKVVGWRPSIVLRSIPDISLTGERYDFIILTTKNTPDIPPTILELITPAITIGHTAILLIQNGINIEIPLISAFPSNVILSGIALVGVAETSPGVIHHTDWEDLVVSPFACPGVEEGEGRRVGRWFVELYGRSGRVRCVFEEDVAFFRWRKLVYNAGYNSACAVTGMDTGRMRMAKFPIDEIVRPLMKEIVIIARAKGIELGDDFPDLMINADPENTFFKPSMQQDIEKGNFIEFENIVGEPLREAEKLGVPAPNLRMIYAILKVLQHKTLERKGLITYPTTPSNVI